MPDPRGVAAVISSWSFLVLGGALLLAFFCIGVLSERARFPSTLAFILLGLLLIRFSPAESVPLQQAAQIGIVLMFFIRGLEFPLERMKQIAIRVWPAGIMDLLISFGGSFIIASLFGLDLLSSFIIASVTYASSSSIIIKMLEEKKRLAAAESEFILALLIFEDLLAPVLVSFLASMAGGRVLGLGGVGIVLGKVAVLAIGSGLLGRILFRRSGGFFARYLEEDIMPLFAVGWALLTAGLAMAMGLSEFLGAFLAGVMIAETGQARELDHLLLPLRNLALPFFFFWFGSTIQIGQGVPYFPILMVLLVWSTVGKFAVGYWGGRLYGLTPMRSYRAALSLVPRGEFSAIAAAFAATPLRIFAGIYIVGTATIGLLLFNYAFPLARWLAGMPQADPKKRKNLLP
jgi:monovalent cation:H+ antiporter-2, CPA2 family